MRAAGMAMLLMVGGDVVAQSPRAVYDHAVGPFRADLARLCPAKRLDLLAPAELRDVLERYAAKASRARQHAMAAEEASFCATSVAGATCPNVADLLVARRQGFTRRLARLTCRAYRGCSEQSDCTAAP